MDGASDENLSGRAGGQTVRRRLEETRLMRPLAGEVVAGASHSDGNDFTTGPAAECARNGLTKEDKMCSSLTGKRRW